MRRRWRTPDIAATGLDEVTAKGIYAAAKAVAAMMSDTGDEEGDAE